MAYAGSKKFQYQQLQYCPQRNVSSISKEKMFNSTVSRYDPITGRTTLIQFCPKDNYPTSPTIIIDFSGGPQEKNTLTFTIIGSGYYNNDSDDSKYKFKKSEYLRPLNITCSVPAGNRLYIYSFDVTEFRINTPNNVNYLSFSNANALTLIEVTNGSLSDDFVLGGTPELTNLKLTGMDIKSIHGITSTPKLKNLVINYLKLTQAAADNICSQLISNRTLNGYLNILNQTSGMLNIYGPSLATLKSSYNWEII
jgi:hypothetical protein